MIRLFGLIPSQKQALVRDGYLLVRSLLDPRVVEPMRRRLDELIRDVVAGWDADPAVPAAAEIVETGVVHASLATTEPYFIPGHDHPVVADADAAVLGPDWHLAELSLRASLPGCGHQGLHPDFEHR